MQNEIFEELHKVFKNNRKKLTFIQEDLQSDFEDVLKLHSLKYNLISSTDMSVNPAQYYSIKSRVKTEHSFKEKLYRKNLGLQISLKHELTIDNFKSKHLGIRRAILLLDDILGVRIVSELKHDRKFAYDLIKNENQYFVDREIIFNENELNNQPEYMKNGLPIFRIKGVYKSKYGFELQIKSKIDEAWGDMDHSLFYKDYSVSPIKNTVQITMNNVGHLFDKIEDLLLGLRNSEAHYKEKKDEIDFLHELSGSAFNEIKTKLGDNYDLSSIASSIKLIKNKTKIKKEDSEIRNLNFSFLELTSQDNDLSKYIKCRNLNFELIILESLYWFWMTKIDIKNAPDQQNYEKQLKVYFDILLDNLLNNVNSISRVNFINVSKVEISKFVKIASPEAPAPIYLDPKKIYQALIIKSLLSEAIFEYNQDSDINIDVITESIEDIYFNVYFHADIIKVTNDLAQNPDFELNNLNDIIFNVNKKLQHQLNLYKIDENYNTLHEVKFLEKLLSNVLESVKLFNDEYEIK